MLQLRKYLPISGILAGATLGAGIFALPYIAAVSGIWLVIGYTVVLALFVTVAHALYWRVLQATNTDEHLLSLTRRYLGVTMSRIGFIAIVVGLLLTLSAYLLLGMDFLSGLFGWSPNASLLIFWIICSLPIALKLRRFIEIEFGATVLMILLVLTVLVTVPLQMASLRSIVWENFFLPFGPILFALAGWTAIEPMVSASKHDGINKWKALLGGTFAVAIIYILFMVGIGSVSHPITPDTLSGLTTLPFWKIGILLVFGLFAILTSYLPMSLEVKNALVGSLKWPKSLAFIFTLFMPYVLVLAGLNNFLQLIEIVGGVFLAIQYLIILLIARVVLKPQGMWRVALDVLVILFSLAMVYQIYALWL